MEKPKPLRFYLVTYFKTSVIPVQILDMLE